MKTVEITLKITAEVDGIYDESLEDKLFEEATKGIYGVFDLSDNCALLVNSIELEEVKELDAD